MFLLRLLEEDGQGSEKCWPPPHSCQGQPSGQDLDRPPRASLQTAHHTGPGLHRSEPRLRPAGPGHRPLHLNASPLEPDHRADGRIWPRSGMWGIGAAGVQFVSTVGTCLGIVYSRRALLGRPMGAAEMAFSFYHSVPHCPSHASDVGHRA